MRRRFPHPARAASALFLAASLALAGGCEADGRAGGASGTVEIPRPDLSRMEAGAAERIRAAQREIERLQEGEGTAAEDLAAAWGELGKLFFAYELHEAAETSFRRAEAAAPADVRWPAYRGMVLQAAGDLAASGRSLERALELAPDELALHVRLGDVRREAGDAENAARSYRGALELEPATAAAHRGLGMLAAEEGRDEEAIAHLERALELAPAATSLHYQLGQLYRRTGDAASAGRHLAASGDGVVTIPDPLRAAVLRLRAGTAFDVVRQLGADVDRLSVDDLLGFAIVQFGDAAVAIREFEGALARREAELAPPERARARFVLGALHARQGDHDQAVESYREAVRLDGGLDAARVQLGWSLSRLGRREEGLAEIEAVLARRPDDPRALLKRAALRTELGRREAARRDLRHLLEIEPANPEAHLRLARLAEDESRLDEAEAGYRRALELAMPAADRALASYRLGEIARRRGEEDAAEAHYRAALRVDPTILEARLALAAGLVRRGELEAAREELDRALAQAPGEPAAVLGQVGVLSAMGRHREAGRVLERGLEASPRDPSIAAALARVLAGSPDPAVRDGTRALALASRLVEHRATDADVETLAMALAQAGRFDQAAARQRELVARARAEGRAADARRLLDNLARYERGEPCCAAP